MPHKCRKCGSTFDDTGKVISRPSEIIKEAKTMPEEGTDKSKRKERKFTLNINFGNKKKPAPTPQGPSRTDESRERRQVPTLSGLSKPFPRRGQSVTPPEEESPARFSRRGQATTPPESEPSDRPPRRGEGNMNPEAGSPGSGKIQCQNWGCRYVYDMSEPFCPICGTANPRFHLKHGQTLCQCGKIYDVGKKTCPHCGTTNPKYVLARNETKCPQCGSIYNIDKKFCTTCGAYNYARPKKVDLSESLGHRISGRVYEILMYELAGVFCIFGLPFLGLPSFLYLGIVLMVLFPLYTYLPSESEVLASRTGYADLGGFASGAVVFKSIIKLSAFVLTVFQFTILPVSKLIPLAISFVYYFGLPTSYRTSQPSKMVEAWLRLGVGVVIALFFLMGFAGTSQGVTLAFMAAAFFCTSFPKQKEEQEPGVISVHLLAKGYGSVQTGTHIIGAVLFFILMIMAVGYSGIPFSFSGMNMVFYSVFILSLLGGLLTGPDGRPAMGVLMITMALFVFSFMFTGIIGEAVFGYWWPQIYSFVNSMVEPLIPLLQQATVGMSDAWLLLTNPMQYYNVMMMRQQATQSVVKTGGSIKAIELLKFDIFTSTTGTLEPLEDPVIGSIELQNQGEFEANKIKLTFISEWVKASSVSVSEGTVTQIAAGILDKLECSIPGISTPSGSRGTCVWGPDIIYPNEIKMSTFAYTSNAKNSNAWALADGSGNLADCELNGNPSGCYADVNTTYKFGGDILKISANYSFDYNVNVSIPVEVIEWNRYVELLAARQITLQELTSQYSGGPVKATLWSQKQPIRNGESSLFVASIYNDGVGLLNQIYNFDVKIPKELGTVEKIAQSFRRTPPSGNEPDGCDNPVLDGNYFVIHCQHTCGESCVVKTGEFKRVSFLITPTYGVELIDRKSTLIIGLGRYEYTQTTSQSLTIANFPPH